MLIPAADLLCRKTRILSTPDRTYHQAPRSVEFLAIRSSLAVSIASCRHPIQLLSGFGEIRICRNKIRHTKPLVLFLRMMLKYAQQKRSSLKCNCSVPNDSPHEATRAAVALSGNGQPRRRPEQPPGSNTRVCLDFGCMAFLYQGGASWLKVVRQVLSLVSSSRLQEKSDGGIDSGRRVIPVIHPICCSALRALASLHFWFYVCLRGETWVLSLMLQVC